MPWRAIASWIWPWVLVLALSSAMAFALDVALLNLAWCPDGPNCVAAAPDAIAGNMVYVGEDNWIRVDDR